MKSPQRHYVHNTNALAIMPSAVLDRQELGNETKTSSLQCYENQRRQTGAQTCSTDVVNEITEIPSCALPNKPYSLGYSRKLDGE